MPIAAAAAAKVGAKLAAAVVVVRRRRGRSILTDTAASPAERQRTGVWRSDPEDEIESIL